MTTVGQWEVRTQRCVVDFCRDILRYVCLGNWKDRVGNHNVEKGLLAS